MNIKEKTFSVTFTGDGVENMDPIAIVEELESIHNVKMTMFSMQSYDRFVSDE